jgi:hypothetical protein
LHWIKLEPQHGLNDEHLEIKRHYNDGTQCAVVSSTKNQLEDGVLQICSRAVRDGHILLVGFAMIRHSPAAACLDSQYVGQ